MSTHQGMPPMLVTGMQLGPYKILGPLGAGGMGEVYRAADARPGRDVALKILPARFAEDPDHLVRFQREAKAVAALAHPNIVVVHDFGTDQGIPFAVTELLEGETLRQRLAQSALPWRKAVELAVAVADGLAAAHAKGIIHRDLKPDNVFVTADERVKILDFGLARLLTESTSVEPVATQSYSPVLTKTGTILGTAPYMSPEQLRGRPVDARGDIFSFGCMLYEMVAGKRPFVGDTSADITAAILHNDPPDLAASGKKVSAELERVIRRCLEKNPEARFQSARDLAFALRGIATGSTEVQPVLSPGRSRVYIGTAVGAIALVAVILAITFWPKHPTVVFPELRKSDEAAPIAVAVLPFVNNTKDPETAYLMDGVPEGIVKSLSEVGKLKVRSFSSVARLAGQEVSLQELGRKLKVQAVLTGKISPRRDGFALAVELVNVADDSVLWSEHFDSKPSELQNVQLKIARQICHNLKVTVTAQEEKRFAKRYTANAEAYQQYLIGRNHWFKFTAESFKKAEECFLLAIQMDPNYALAYAGLADTYQASFRSAGTDKMEKAKKAAQRALELDDQLAEAHTALAAIHQYAWDWPDAEREYKRAVQINPSLALGWDAYSGFLMRMKRFADAEEAMKKSIDLDPITPYINNNVPKLAYFRGQFDLAIQEGQKLLKVDRDFAAVYRYVGMAHVKKSQYREALAAFERANQLNGTPNDLALVAYGQAAGGDKEAARKTLEELITSAKQPFVDPSRLALIHMALGEKGLACDYLEKAYAAHSGYLADMYVDPVYDSLRRAAVCGPDEEDEVSLTIRPLAPHLAFALVVFFCRRQFGAAL